MKIALLAALLLSAAGTSAIAETKRGPAAHMRPQLFHDRAPHVHNRSAQQHHGS